MSRKVVPLALVGCFAPRAAAACPICFGAAHGPMLDAARLGVLVMLGITLAVLTAFALFFRRIR